MADIYGTAQTVKFDFFFVDGDTRSLSIKNPKSNITTTEIENLQTFMRTNNIIVGDKDGGTFGRIDKVTRITESKLKLDLAS